MSFTPNYSLNLNMPFTNIGSFQPAFNSGVGNFAPMFNPGFGSFNPGFNMGFSGFGFGSTNSTSSSSSKGFKEGESYDEYQARKAKNREKVESEYKKLQEEIKTYEASIKDVEKIVKKAETATEDKETGLLKTEETMEDYKKQPWWKKALRAGGNMVQGFWSLATELVGYEQNPETGERKWNWKKCVKNVAIAAGCVALTCIPGVGPFISAGLLASGVVAGAIGVGKGVVKACNAEKPEEIDQAFQEIGKGATVGVTSALGLKGLGKGFRAANGFSTKGGLFRDMTVNAFKATKSAAAAQKTAIAQNGWWSTFGSNLKNSFVPKLGKRKMEQEITSTKSSIDKRVSKIDTRLNELAGQNPTEESMLEEALLNQEKAQLVEMKSSIDALKTKQDWELFAKDNKVVEFKTKLDNYTAGDKIKVTDPTGRSIDYTFAEKDLNMIDGFSSRMGEFSQQAAELAKTREATIKYMSLSGKNGNAVKQYNGKKLRANQIGRVWDFVRPEQKTTLLGKAGNCIAFPIKSAFKVMMIPYKPWDMINKSPAAAFFKFESTVVNPIYEEAWLKNTFGMGDKALTTVGEDGKVVSIIQDGKSVALVDENGNAVPLTKEDIKNIKEYIETSKQKIADDRKKQAELYA